MNEADKELKAQLKEKSERINYLQVDNLRLYGDVASFGKEMKRLELSLKQAHEMNNKREFHVLQLESQLKEKDAEIARILKLNDEAEDDYCALKDKKHAEIVALSDLYSEVVKRRDDEITQLKEQLAREGSK